MKKRKKKKIKKVIDLILSTGTNLGDRVHYLKRAEEQLNLYFNLKESSQIYESTAVDFEDQPDFLNQVHHYLLDKELPPEEILKIINKIEALNGRQRHIDKGPRTLDIDILFYGLRKITGSNLTIPHPRQFQRSFIITPLKELVIFEELKKSFDFPDTFDNSCWVFEA